MPVAQRKVVLAPLGYGLVSPKTRSAERVILCIDARGEVARYGLVALPWVEED